ncbi:MAG: hypothetical protein OJI70_12105 [Zavarzinia sp.]|nr:hypothetical protein [Zavarzinia sp.]
MRLPLLLTALIAATPAIAGSSGPHGRYIIDVDATYQALVDAKAATETSRGTLERQKELIFLDFTGDTLSFVAGPKLGGGVKGRCRWRLDKDLILTEACGQPDGRPFSVTGQIGFDADSGTLSVTGNAPVPIRYRAQ